MYDASEKFSAMTKPIPGFLRSDLSILVLVAVARFVLHLATNGNYGFHRDELQTLDDARLLDWVFSSIRRSRRFSAVWS